MKQFKNFQIRWNEKLGDRQGPYISRFVLILFGYSIRIHKWKCGDGIKDTDGNTALHDHGWWFITLVLRGSYTDVSPAGRDRLTRFSIRFRKAQHRHYVEVPRGGCTTLLITGRMKRKWGFWTNDKFKRPLKYFNKHIHPVCEK